MTPFDLGGPVTQSENAINRIVDAFELAWTGETVPEVSAFLPDSELRSLVLRELLRIDLEHRLRRQLPVDVAGYQSAFADLVSPEMLAELRRDEARLRHRPAPGVPER